jgi:hypothetical protein
MKKDRIGIIENWKVSLILVIMKAMYGSALL